jgi:hypothetical protein
MKGIRVDPSARRAQAQPGVLWGELDQQTQASGLATTGGIVTHTGIAGLTLGGGIGWLMRKHGLTADNLMAAEVVTAEGERISASETERPELLWGLRGGGGNFGVVTSFEYRLQPIGPAVLAGPVLWAMEDARPVLRHYRELVADAPDELTTIVSLRKAPDLPAIPPELRGRRVCQVAACWCGPIDRGEQILSPLRRFGRPLLDLVRPRPYLALQSMLDALVPHGWHYYWKSCELPPLDDRLIDVLVEQAEQVESKHSYAILFQLGGAVGRVPEDATAYAHRQAAHNLNINGVWLPGEPIGEREMAWTRRFYAAVAPFQVGVYVNFLGDEGPERVREAYGRAKYARLARLKHEHDPDNFFRLNQNIRPVAIA